MNDTREPADANGVRVDDDAADSVDETASKRNAGWFAKGTSGNARGRPRKKVDERSILDRTFEAPVSITVNGKKESLPYMEVLLMRVRNQVLRGDLGAAKIMLSHCRPEHFDKVARSAAERKELGQKRLQVFFDECDEATLMQMRNATKRVIEVFPETPGRTRRRQ